MTAFDRDDWEAWLRQVSEVGSGWHLHATANDCDSEADAAAEIADAATAALTASRQTRDDDGFPPVLFLTAEEVEQIEAALDEPATPNDKLAALMRRATVWATPDGES